MKTSEEIIKALEAKIKTIQEESAQGLKNLNKHVSVEDANVNSMFLLSDSYYREVARYAWAYRAKLIVTYELQSLIEDFKR